MIKQLRDYIYNTKDQRIMDCQIMPREIWQTELDFNYKIYFIGRTPSLKDRKKQILEALTIFDGLYSLSIVNVTKAITNGNLAIHLTLKFKNESCLDKARVLLALYR